MSPTAFSVQVSKYALHISAVKPNHKELKKGRCYWCGCAEKSIPGRNTVSSQTRRWKHT